MSKMIEVPDELYEEWTEVAAEDGTTPLGWVAARLRLLRRSRLASSRPNGQSVAERAAELGLLGVVNSGGTERLSERHSEVFGDILEEKRKAGRL